jgi:hypothetical protein
MILLPLFQALDKSIGTGTSRLNGLHNRVFEPLSILPEVFPQIPRALESSKDRPGIQILGAQFLCKFIGANWRRDWRAAEWTQ